MPDPRPRPSKPFLKILDLVAQYRAKKAKLARNEDLPAQTVESPDPGLPIHPEVQPSDQGEPPANSRSSRRRSG